MKKIGTSIQNMVSQLSEGSDSARINMRTQQVRERYKKALESVYHENAQIHLAHTNNVIITTRNGIRQLIVYVDDSLFAAELNAQRELIKLQLLQLFGEEIDEFKISVSQWKKYRDFHPYVLEEPSKAVRKPSSIPLDDKERSFVSNIVSRVDDEKIRAKLEKAMTADMEWKKAEKANKEPKDS